MGCFDVQAAEVLMRREDFLSCNLELLEINESKLCEFVLQQVSEASSVDAFLWGPGVCLPL